MKRQRNDRSAPGPDALDELSKRQVRIKSFTPILVTFLEENIMINNIQHDFCNSRKSPFIHSYTTALLG